MTSTGASKLDKLKKIFSNDNFVKHCDMELLDAYGGYSKVRMKLGDQHANFFGTVHGGAIFGLADTALGAAANAYGTLSVAIGCNIHYMKAARTGCLTAIAEEVSLNHNIATYTVTIYDDEEDVVAIFQGMVYRKRQDILELKASSQEPCAI
ncbi:MAG TPA: PaaI family thioesterase [Candidatus Methanofastidiosa archaeon]|nr:PaaI family thioesterase [Candidatus Methanofastidiosa archaeon]